MVKKYNFLHLFLWVISFQVIAGLMGFMTSNSIDTWYLTLNRSSLTPPNIVFPIVWTILYTMIATAGWMLWSQPQNSNLTWAKNCYIMQLVCNWLWTPLFFGLHLTGLALIDTILIVVFNILLLINTYVKRSPIFWLLLPYLIWSFFAAYLNLIIWLYN